MPTDDDFSRYDRQMRYPHLGTEGQERLSQASVLLCGCGALGSLSAQWLVRAGVGRLRIVDRDFIELNNLQRQSLFDEQDIADELPKAVAAARKLERINSQVIIEPVVADVGPTNIEQLADGVDLILDGSDNFELRYLINDLAVAREVPWIFAGVIGAEGQTMTILPGETGCLRCLLPEPPPAGSMPTCDTAGVLGPAVGVIASLQALEAMKILSGHREAVSRSLTVLQLWDNRIRQIDLANLPGSVDCPCCGRREFTWLSGQQASQTAVLCGRNAVQISPPGEMTLDLAALARKLEGVGPVTHNRWLLRLTTGKFQITVFADGRAVVAGTDEIAQARSLYAKYVGG